MINKIKRYIKLKIQIRKIKKQINKPRTFIY